MNQDRWSELDEMESQPLIPMLDCERVLTAMQDLNQTPKGTRELVRRFGGTRSLTYAFAMAAVTGSRIRSRIPKTSYVVGGQLWRRLRFRQHGSLLAGIVGSIAFLAASVPPRRRSEIDLSCDICRVALETCQIDLSQRRVNDARDLFDRVEAIIEALPPDGATVLLLRVEAKRVSLLIDLMERME